jgi:hypothetical protein
LIFPVPESLSALHRHPCPQLVTKGAILAAFQENKTEKSAKKRLRVRQASAKQVKADFHRIKSQF